MRRLARAAGWAVATVAGTIVVAAAAYAGVWLALVDMEQHEQCGEAGEDEAVA